MKIIVDEMPKTPRECPYGNKWDYEGEVIGCDKDNIWCVDTNDCPFFISLKEAMKEGKAHG